jgi:holo-[acyl-carrier protein] synthase
LIYGIGTDIVSVSRMADNLKRYGDRFAQRILADNELEEFRTNVKPAHFVAKRFAAKEAAVKAFGMGFRVGISLRHIAVIHDGFGKPVLQFHGEALRFVEQNGITRSYISLSDEDHYAIAYVILTLEPSS